MQRLSSKWFVGQHGSDTDKEDLEKLIRSSTIVIGQLRKLITVELQENEAMKVGDYADPNWAYRQADRNGAIRVLRNLLSLTDFAKDGPNA